MNSTEKTYWQILAMSSEEGMRAKGQLFAACGQWPAYSGFAKILRKELFNITYTIILDKASM